jgi:hypothetical protein
MMHHKKIASWVLVSISIISYACNPARVVKPLAKSETMVGANIGGPAIYLGSAPIFIPLTSIYAARGLTDRTTMFASLQTTSALFGVFQTDIGITQGIIKPKGWIPGISISPVVNLMFDRWEKKFSFYPEVDVFAYWHYKPSENFIYAGMNNWFELRNTRAHGEVQQTHWIPSISLGHQWKGKKLNFQLEVKYIAPNLSNENIVVDYISLSQSGAIGFYFGINKVF